MSCMLATISSYMFPGASVERVRGAAMKKENIPALIRELRQRLYLTQEQFAQRVGVTYSTVNHWENGKRVPLPFLVKRLVEMKTELDSQEAKSARKKT
ncbi:MAG: helix-turn-helix transcriptional regulator [Candidatus Aminicenantes bacterium]|nr:helix-turn-helix transcriptional regulator [Candidatus Aminicenantes bacterium]